MSDKLPDVLSSDIGLRAKVNGRVKRGSTNPEAVDVGFAIAFQSMSGGAVMGAQ